MLASTIRSPSIPYTLNRLSTTPPSSFDSMAQLPDGWYAVICRCRTISLATSSVSAFKSGIRFPPGVEQPRERRCAYDALHKLNSSGKNLEINGFRVELLVLERFVVDIRGLDMDRSLRQGVAEQADNRDIIPLLIVFAHVICKGNWMFRDTGLGWKD